MKKLLFAALTIPPVCYLGGKTIKKKFDQKKGEFDL